MFPFKTFHINNINALKMCLLDPYKLSMHQIMITPTNGRHTKQMIHMESYPEIAGEVLNFSHY